MKAKLLLVKCLTNLHVGSGEANYNIIDKEVEKDPITNYPTINASGVKGAFREYFEANKLENIDEIFGGAGDSKPGQIKFLQANILALAMRVSSGINTPFALVTTKNMIESINTLSRKLGCSNSISIKKQKDIFVEGIKCEFNGGVKQIGQLAKMDEDSFKNIRLPIIARNCLENGISKNLWYEEIVPHESIFCIPVMSDNAALLDKFIESVNDKLVQFGGNASIGYGLCTIRVWGENNNEQKQN